MTSATFPQSAPRQPGGQFACTTAMVADGRDLIRVAPWVSVAPGIAAGIAVLGFNLLGDGLRDALDPLNRRGR